MFGWVRGGGLLSRVVEKTISVTENVITTLDPQMRDFIHSGGDVQIVVASDKDEKVGAIREAFQNVFGHATIVGLPSRCSNLYFFRIIVNIRTYYCILAWQSSGCPGYSLLLPPFTCTWS
ncbi:protein PRRC1 [Eurytemora carolleeae]|uniref:protein PRRC1 n=1 Tax=Eurytemora carolleeae TaxID=1294199 RepID=UPI000C75D91B|nr:protein PRRC1 [Eurytemora carolleeae]|eukprot:XP_023328125.1 protein PRRC1-like [Eurytemora affinis]